MPQKFDCPSCGAPLDAPQDGAATLRCPFCSASVIVPVELHERSEHAPQINIVSSRVETSSESFSFSEAQFTPLDSGAVMKTARRTTAAGCVSVGITLVILLFVGAMVALGLTLPGGPLEGLWARINPTAFARLTLEFGGEGTGPGLFNDVRAIAVDPASGHIYAADYTGGRVQAFDPTGLFLLQWNVGDRKSIITCMSADRQGVVYVTVGGKILRYDGATGKLLGEVPHAGELSYYDFVVSTPDGGLVAVDSDETIVKLDSDFNARLTLTEAVSTVSGDAELDTRLAVDGAGNIYALGLFNNAVFKFGPDGRFINRFGGEGDQPGQFQAPDAIAVDGKGRVFVSDINGIQVFDSDGRYLRKFDVMGVAFGMTFTDQGELVITTNDQKVFRYTLKDISAGG